MQWSSKRGSIVKLSSVTKGEEKEIVTKIVEKKEPEDNLPNEEQLLISRMERKLAKEREEHRKKLEQMEQEIIAKANAEAEQIREDAQKKGYDDGQQSGYQDGYQAGLKIAQKVIEQEKSNLNQANEDCQKFAKEKEKDLRKFAIKLAEILIKKQLDVDASTITNILAPVFIELEKPDEMIIVRANARYKQPLIDRLDKMHKEVPNLRYSVLEDEGLEPYTVKIESNESFITVDVKEDLEKFLKSLGEQNEHD